MMEEFGFGFPDELRSEFRKKRIIVVDDETGEIEEILKESDDEVEN